MKGKTKKIVLAVAVIGAIAAGGVAFTAANTLPTTTTAGYKSMTVSGAVVTAINYTLSADGTDITAVKLTFSSPADLTDPAMQVKIGFNGNAMTDCAVSSATVADCTGLTEDTEGAQSLEVAVANQ
jgi:hypothetical protein